MGRQNRYNPRQATRNGRGIGASGVTGCTGSTRATDESGVTVIVGA